MLVATSYGSSGPCFFNRWERVPLVASSMIIEGALVILLVVEYTNYVGVMESECVTCFP